LLSLLPLPPELEPLLPDDPQAAARATTASPTASAVDFFTVCIPFISMSMASRGRIGQQGHRRGSRMVAVW
jgi:hypothetical protein